MTNPIAITRARAVLPDRIMAGAAIVIEDGTIQAINGAPPAGAEIIDAQNHFVLPGLIDLHAHGRVAIPDPATVMDRIREDSRDFASHGVTAWIPTFASAPLDAWRGSLDAIAAAIGSPFPGAVPLGVHLEGVFINPASAGAQPPQWIVPFDPANPAHTEIFTAYPGLVRLAILAPEVGVNHELIELCLANGIVPALGHTACPAEDVHAFAGRGLKHVTHLFNGMKPLNHRDPGPIAAALTDDRLTVELIADGFHLDPEIVRLIHRLKPPGKRLLVTDSVLLDLPGATPGGPDEPNTLPGGRLAGSRLRLFRAVLNYMEFTGCPLPEAVNMASLWPARLIGEAQTRGSLAPGKRADLFIAGDGLEPALTMVGGRTVCPN